jgi:hypothetical protein
MYVDSLASGDPRRAGRQALVVVEQIGRDMMSRVVGVRLGTELQSKLEALCARMGQHRSEVMRQVLTVVSVEQLCPAIQESKGTREERALS